MCEQAAAAAAGGMLRAIAALNGDDPQIKQEILQLILQYLSDEGFAASVTTVQDEANVRRLEAARLRPAARRLRRAVLEGDWPEVEKQCSRAISGEAEQKAFLYSAYRLQYLELLDEGEHHKARESRHALAPNAPRLVGIRGSRWSAPDTRCTQRACPPVAHRRGLRRRPPTGHPATAPRDRRSGESTRRPPHPRPPQAFSHLTKRLKPLEACAPSPGEFRDLCYLLTCRSVEEVRSRQVGSGGWGSGSGSVFYWAGASGWGSGSGSSAGLEVDGTNDRCCQQNVLPQHDCAITHSLEKQTLFAGPARRPPAIPFPRAPPHHPSPISPPRYPFPLTPCPPPPPLRSCATGRARPPRARRCCGSSGRSSTPKHAS